MGQNHSKSVLHILLGFAAVVSAETPTLRALYLLIPHRILQAHDEALELATDCQTHKSLSH